MVKTFLYEGILKRENGLEKIIEIVKIGSGNFKWTTKNYLSDDFKGVLIYPDEKEIEFVMIFNIKSMKFFIKIAYISYEIQLKIMEMLTGILKYVKEFYAVEESQMWEEYRYKKIGV